jgi:lipoprotein-releasing system permease protein
MAGVGVSSCALCSVTSIMGGFGHDLKRKILGNNAHHRVDVTRSGGFGDWGQARAARSALAPLGGAATPVAGGDAMGSSASNTAGVLVRGIDVETIGQVIDLRRTSRSASSTTCCTPRSSGATPDAAIGRGPDGEPYFKGPMTCAAATPIRPWQGVPEEALKVLPRRDHRARSWRSRCTCSWATRSRCCRRWASSARRA